MEEYRALRSEIELRLKARETMTIYITIANYVYVGTLIAYTPKSSVLGPGFLIVAAWIPFFITAFALAILTARAITIRRIGTYLRLIEERYAFNGAGWEAFPTTEKMRTGITQFSPLAYAIHFQLFLALVLAVSVTMSVTGFSIGQILHH